VQSEPSVGPEPDGANTGSIAPLRPIRKRKELGSLRQLGVSVTISAPVLNRAASTPTSEKRRKCRLYPMHPDSRRRAFFDILSMFVLLYDSVMIPVQVAWNTPLTGYFAVSSFATLGFWTMDLILGFFTGYRKQDKMVMDFRRIAKHYLSTYFLPNLLVVVFDVTGIIIEYYSDNSDNGDAISQSLLLKLTRAIKMNRLMRFSALIRAGRVAELHDLVTTVMRRFGMAEKFSVAMRVGKLVFLILWVNHFGCCLWHLIGEEASRNWYEEAGVESRPGLDYLLGYFWSASAMIAGEGVMTPTNAAEMICTIFFVVFGFIFSSVLISTLLTVVMDYQMNNKERSDKLKTLRQFLYQHQVDSRIALPVEKQCVARLSRVKRLSEKDVSALSLLSPLMRSELTHSIYGPSLSNSNTFIRTCNILGQTFLKDLCFCALTHSAHEPGEHIFQPHIEALGAYLLYWGTLEYLPFSPQKMSGSSCSLEESHTQQLQVVAEGTWICELALWAQWQHRGWMEAATPCELLALQAEPFLRVLAGHPDLYTVAQDYAGAFCNAACREPPDALNDLKMVLDHESIVSAMPLESRTVMSSAAMLWMERRDQWSGRLFQRQGMQALSEEVDSGDCDLVLYAPDRVLRVVTIVAIRIMREEDHRVLAQIGKCIRGTTMGRCTLPGTKVRVGELPRDAVERLVASKLAPWKDAVSLGMGEVDVEERVSKKYGVPSKYMRTVYHSQLDETEVAQDAEQELARRPHPEGDQAAHNASIHGHRSEEARQIVENKAFTLGDKESPHSLFIYAWLPLHEFEFLTSGAAGDAIAHHWVSTLDVQELEEQSKRVSDDAG